MMNQINICSSKVQGVQWLLALLQGCTRHLTCLRKVVERKITPCMKSTFTCILFGHLHTRTKDWAAQRH
jgi:hypothetical protein